jgi:hypothetical protein
MIDPENADGTLFRVKAQGKRRGTFLGRLFCAPMTAISDPEEIAINRGRLPAYEVCRFPRRPIIR